MLRLPRAEDSTLISRRTSHQSSIRLTRRLHHVVEKTSPHGLRESVPRPGEDSSSDQACDRSRTRTQQSPRLRATEKTLDLPEDVEEVEADVTRAGTTSKSFIGSALAGFCIVGFGLGPIIKALRTITYSATNTQQILKLRQGLLGPWSGGYQQLSRDALGLHSVSSAEVS